MFKEKYNLFNEFIKFKSADADNGLFPTNMEDSYAKNKTRSEILFHYPARKKDNSYLQISKEYKNNLLNSNYNSYSNSDNAVSDYKKNILPLNKTISSVNNSTELTKIEPFVSKIKFPDNNINNPPSDNISELTKSVIKNNGITLKLSGLFGLEEAAQNLEMAKNFNYLDTPYARNHKIYKNVNQVEDFLRDFVSAKIVSQLGSDMLYEIGGIYFAPNSSASKKLASNLNLLYKIQQHAFELNNDKVINDSLNFKDVNFHNAVGKADILFMRKNIYNEVELFIIDIYDFNKNSSNPLVKAGNLLQSEGYLIPYFVIYSVIIPSDVSDIYLNKLNI